MLPQTSAAKIPAAESGDSVGTEGHADGHDDRQAQEHKDGRAVDPQQHGSGPSRHHPAVPVRKARACAYSKTSEYREQCRSERGGEVVVDQDHLLVDQQRQNERVAAAKEQNRHEAADRQHEDQGDARAHAFQNLNGSST